MTGLAAQLRFGASRLVERLTELAAQLRRRLARAAFRLALRLLQVLDLRLQLQHPLIRDPARENNERNRKSKHNVDIPGRKMIPVVVQKSLAPTLQRMLFCQ